MLREEESVTRRSLLTTLTRDTAQQMKRRRVGATLVQHALLGGPWQRDRQRDGSVKFTPARFDGYDWTDGHAVA